MIYFTVKLLISALLIAVISEIAKKYTFIAAAIASLPLLTILSVIWIYIETKSVAKVIEFSHNVFWLVIPSLTFFLSLPLLLKLKLPFFLSLFLSVLIMISFYFLFVMVLKKAGIQF